ncbi:putative hydrophobins [Lyophyllum shimeji]|uniref:Hydrophobin n=1 Tax=Lyophyllum shimeji TaxID=47721 RepID=A0A9P3URJ5_LYOSH|nr:putative hydrophobins [Lyophyllum shimeji]
MEDVSLQGLLLPGTPRRLHGGRYPLPGWHHLSWLIVLTPQAYPSSARAASVHDNGRSCAVVASLYKKMFSRIYSMFLLVLLAFTALAAATTTVTVTVTPPGPTSTPLPASQCGTGNLQCCNALERSDGSVVGVLLGLLGVVLQGVEVLIGITCSPIDILGLGQNSCHEQPVCCQNNDFHGIIAIGCVPININL